MRDPDENELTELAARLGFVMSLHEARAYRHAIEMLEAGMTNFTNVDEDRPPLRQTARDPGYRPKPEDDPYNCIITRCLIKGSREGPLSGKRVGLKDNISVAGIPMTLGSRFMEGYVPDIDATVVTRFLDAGADIVGKLNMDDFSLAAQGFGSGMGDYGRCRNPYAPEHLSGGSSSGSAVAVASGAVDIAVGGDQGGSIRIPAAWCGVVGLKATYGLIPYTGVVSMEPSIDHIGPMGRTVEDVALTLECIAGPDGYDPRQVNVQLHSKYTDEMVKGVEGIRVGILSEGFGISQAEPDVEAVVRSAIADLAKTGARLQEISVAGHSLGANLVPALAMVGTELVVHTYGGAFLQGFYDTHFTQVFGRLLKSRADMLPPFVKLSMLYNAQLREKALEYYGKAQNIRKAYRRAYDEAFRNVDCLLMPTVPIKAPRYNAPHNREVALQRMFHSEIMGVVMRNTAPFNITGHPALTIPCGISQGLPVAIMIVGPHFSEGMLFRIANAIEQSIA